MQLSIQTENLPSRSQKSITGIKMGWEAIFDALTLPVSLHDRHMTVIRANKAFAELTGLSMSDIVGSKCYNLFHKGILPANCPYQKTLDKNIPISSEIKFRERYFNVTSSQVFDDNGEMCAYLHLMNDITERRHAEETTKEEAKVTAALLDVAVAISSLSSIDEVMKRVSAVCRMVFGSTSCMTYLFDKDTGCFVPTAASGLSPAAVPFFSSFRIGKEDMLLIKGLVRDKKIFTIDNAEESPWITMEYARPLGIVSLTAAPVVSMGDVVGLLCVAYDEPRKFSDRDLTILHGISHQISIAVSNARMYQTIMDKSMALSHKIETIQAMNDIDRSILSSIERDVILDTAVSMIGRVISCDMAGVGLVDHEKEEFIYMAGFGNPFSKNTAIPFTDTTATEVLSTGRPQYHDNLKSASNLPPVEKKLMEAGLLSHIRAPLILKGSVIGILGIGSKRPSAFTPDDLSTLNWLREQITVALENSRLVEELRKSNIVIEETFDATVLSLSKLAEFRDQETGYHLERMSHYSELLAEECQNRNISSIDGQFIKEISKASILHDIGKVGIRDMILLKPGKLTTEEFEEMKRHTIIGGEILEAAEKKVGLRSFLTMAKEIAYSHHERYDGSGYPKGLKGEDIPLAARIAALADFYDALTSRRIYRKGASTHEEVKEMILEGEGKHFDPKVVAAFLQRENDFISIGNLFPDK